MGPVGPRWAPCWTHELCDQGFFHQDHVPITRCGLQFHAIHNFCLAITRCSLMWCDDNLVTVFFAEMDFSFVLYLWCRGNVWLVWGNKKQLPEFIPYDRLITRMSFPILKRWYLYIRAQNMLYITGWPTQRIFCNFTSPTTACNQAN